MDVAQQEEIATDSSQVTPSVEERLDRIEKSMNSIVDAVNSLGTRLEETVYALRPAQAGFEAARKMADSMDHARIQGQQEVIKKLTEKAKDQEKTPE